MVNCIGKEEWWMDIEMDEDGLPNRFVYENELKKMEEMDDDSAYWKEVNDSGEIMSIWKLNEKENKMENVICMKMVISNM